MPLLDPYMRRGSYVLRRLSINAELVLVTVIIRLEHTPSRTSLSDSHSYFGHQFFFVTIRAHLPCNTCLLN